MKKVWMIILSVAGLYGSMSPMEQALKKAKVAVYVKVVLADEQATFLSEDQWKTFKTLCSDEIQENLKVENGIISLPSLSSEGFETVVRTLEVIVQGADNLMVFFKGLMQSENFKEFASLVRAADYLGIQSVMMPAFQCLEENIKDLVSDKELLDGKLVSHSFKFLDEYEGDDIADADNHLVALELLSLPFPGECKWLQTSTVQKALLIAAKKGYGEIVEWLLRYGVDPNCVLGNRTALTYGAKYGHRRVVELLLEHGAEVELEKLYEDDASDWKNFSPLMWAVDKRHVEIVQILLEHKANVERQNSEGETALIVAADNGDRAVVAELMKYGAKVQYTRETDDFRPERVEHSALIAAVKGGHEAVVLYILEQGMQKVQALRKPVLSREEMLMEGTSVGPQIDQFHYIRQAAMEDMVLVAQAYQYFARLINLQDDRGNTALIHAVQGGYRGIIRALLLHGALVDVQNSEMETALIIASRKGDLESVQLLLGCGARVDLTKPERTYEYDGVREIFGTVERTALSFAEEKGHAEIIALLKSHGAV